MHAPMQQLGIRTNAIQIGLAMSKTASMLSDSTLDSVLKTSFQMFSTRILVCHQTGHLTCQQQGGAKGMASVYFHLSFQLC